MPYTAQTDLTTGDLVTAAFINQILTNVEHLYNQSRTTGDLQFRASTDDTTNIWLRCDGRTITDAGATAPSGVAIARANADMETLFTHLWTQDTNSNLNYYDSGGSSSSRGASAAADWSAGKQISLPDSRGRIVMTMDDPTGSDAADVITSSWADQIFGTGGSETHTLTESELPAHDHPYATVQEAAGSNAGAQYSNSGALDNGTKLTNNAGSDGAHNNVQPSIALGSWFIYTGN